MYVVKGVLFCFTVYDYYCDGGFKTKLFYYYLFFLLLEIFKLTSVPVTIKFKSLIIMHITTLALILYENE